MDLYFQSLRPENFDISLPKGKHIHGRFIHSKDPSGLYEQFDAKNEYIPNAPEIITLRNRAIELLLNEDPALKNVTDTLARNTAIRDTVFRNRHDISAVLNPIWKMRLTTSTHMVRTSDEKGEDTVFFHQGNPFDSAASIRLGMKGELSDGGFHYDRQALDAIRSGTPVDSRLPYSEYLAARGGNFSGTDLMNHPVFSKAVGNKNLIKDYVWGLQLLNLNDFYNAGLHSVWRPGEMKPDFGRPVALGLKGEAFYPPNNSTVGHSALVLPNETVIE